MRFTFDSMVRAYLVTALWSSAEGDQEGQNCAPFDDWATPDDCADSFRNEARADCLSFVRQCFESGVTHEQLRDIGPCTLGGDLWLTRNGHGAGFWDRGLGALGETLSALARGMGSVDLFTDESGEVCAQ